MNTCEHRPAKKSAPSPALILVGFLFLTSVAQAIVRGLIPIPRCLLLQFTGIPCPTCGCTRSLAAWRQLDLASAFLFNPLFFALCVGGLLWCVVRIVESQTGRELVSRSHLLPGKNSAWAIGGVAVVLNWLYLCLTLPR